MITVKMLGGAKKAFGTDSMQVDRDDITVAELLNVLDGLKSDSSDGIEPKNTLVAINGAEISSSGGVNARVCSGDVVSIIPVVHGGETKLRHTVFEIKGMHLEAYWIGRIKGDAGTYIDRLRTDFPRLVIQAVASRCVLGPSHIEKIAAISLRAYKKDLLLSKKLEIDMLLRFAGTTQISKAIKRVGAKSGLGFVLLVIGSVAQCKKLYSKIDSEEIGCPIPTHAEIAKMFGIDKKEEDACSGGLEDVLVERAAILV
ncbi:MAG: sulfur carrier protein ThiS [Cenarchaeum symbiont of Oopsacas minuta]|nr:sulfur carrier protein ThiS [Cenarchaeum symbiont of Oopsacas minuta]